MKQLPKTMADLEDGAAGLSGDGQGPLEELANFSSKRRRSVPKP
jgi:hypothetical protein